MCLRTGELCQSFLFQITSRSLVEAYIRRIEGVNGIINAVVQDNFKEALIKAQEIDELLSRLDVDDERFRNVYFYFVCFCPL